MNAERLLAHYEKFADAHDAIPRLRRFILDLAVRGKLVPQDPADEPASELLKRIAAEKARLVKAGKLRRRKLASCLDEPPFSLPKSWNWVRIREVVSDRGQTVPARPFTYIDVSAIDKEAGLVADPRVVEPDNAPSRARKVARHGDVVYSCVRPYLLNVAIIEADFNPPPIASTAFEVLNGHGLVLPRYTWMVLRCSFMIACVEQGQRGQAYPAINSRDFAVLPFPLPPLPEQHRIVAKVDELMALCDRLEAASTEREETRDRLSAGSLARLNAPDSNPALFRKHATFALENLIPLTTRSDQIKALRQTILNLAVRGKLVEQDPADEPASELLKRIAAEKAKLKKKRKLRSQRPLPPISDSDLNLEIPIGWQWVHLGDVIKLWNGFAFKSKDFQSQGVPVIRIGDLQSGKVDLSKNVSIPKDIANSIKEEFWIPPHALLIAMSGATTGKVAFNRTGKKLLLNQRVGRIETFIINVNFVRIFFDTIVARNLEISFGTAIPNLSAKQINETVIPLPPLAEQRRIVAKVDELMALCDRLETGLATADTNRTRLLDSLLNEALRSAFKPYGETG